MFREQPYPELELRLAFDEALARLRTRFQSPNPWNGDEIWEVQTLVFCLRELLNLLYPSIEVQLDPPGFSGSGGEDYGL